MCDNCPTPEEIKLYEAEIQERRKALYDALLSGDYKQGRNVLKLEDEDGTIRHCCLGVAAEVAIIMGCDVEAKFDADTKMYYFNDNLEVLDAVVTAWYGFADGNPDVTFSDLHGYDRTVTKTLADLNDSEGYDFAEIAEIIRQNFLTGVDSQLKS
jgi:hypothetical protein